MGVDGNDDQATIEQRAATTRLFEPIQKNEATGSHPHKG